MTEPIPTPFDIVPIPYVPWEPSAAAYATVGLAFLIGLAAVLAAARVRRGGRTMRALRPLMADLLKLSSPDSPQSCERFARLARRILSLLIGLDLSGYSADELRRLAAATADSREAEALSRIAALEEIAYSPDGARAGGALKPVAAGVVESIEGFVRSAAER